MQEFMSASADYDPADENLGLTPSKRFATDLLDDRENV